MPTIEELTSQLRRLEQRAAKLRKQLEAEDVERVQVEAAIAREKEFLELRRRMQIPKRRG